MSKAANTLALCLDMGTSGTAAFKRVCKSTTLTVAQNAETEDFDYIADQNKTTEIKSYAPSIEQDLAILKGEEDYEFVYGRYKEHGVGQDAHIDALLVYMLDGDNTAGYYAEKYDAVMTFTDYNATDGKLNFTLGLGAMEAGKATIANKVATFTAGAAEK